MSLVFDGTAARLCVTMHDQVSQLVRHIKPLAVVVAPDRVEDHDWA